MHIVLISECQKRSIKRTRAVLDRYALRVGQGAWMTPITEEGLGELRKELKRVATRQTAVACYRNDGRKRMRRLWVVGSTRPFGPDGHLPCATTRSFGSTTVEEWMSIACLLAKVAGYGHDIGKLWNFFVEKLEHAIKHNASLSDSVRHEWLSMRFLQLMFEAQSPDYKAIADPLAGDKILKVLPFKQKGLNNEKETLSFVIATHHRLFAGPGMPGSGNHIDSQRITEPSLAADMPIDLLAKIECITDRLSKLLQDKVKRPAYWRAMAIWVRAAVIFADHEISAKYYDEEVKTSVANQKKPPFANTKQSDKGMVYNQPLDWHLDEVAHLASQTMYRMTTMMLPGLSEVAIENIMTSAPEGSSFSWQDKGVRVLQRIRLDHTDDPVLVLNVAGTGSGKTRANAKFACALAPSGRVRFSYALNQKTLTLQTGDSLSEELRVGKDELATVIGDRVALKLHTGNKSNQTAEDDDSAVFESDADSDALSFPPDLPSWLSGREKTSSHLNRILATPILASTIDYIIAAGDLTRQGNHVNALLRVIDSDLIVDEVDSYDPKALVAVLRMIQIAAMCGRSVICSSATLAIPMADAIHDAFQSGVALRQNLLGQDLKHSPAVIIDDQINPLVIDSNSKFGGQFKAHLMRMMEKLVGNRLRMPILQRLAEKTEAGWLVAIQSGVQTMHDNNAWDFGKTGKKVSFGLVRIANIRTAIKVARYLTEQFSEAQIACYHSQDFVLQRFLKEKTLDRLLTRKYGAEGNDNLLHDKDIRRIVDAAPDGTSVPFIVVATPVEEIGRDHDFDWAVIEPSSTQSIVQTAGRVNRHRRKAVDCHNIAILQYNYRYIKNLESNNKGPCFRWPGLESNDNRYGSHDIERLLNFEILQDGLDARLRFYADKHDLAKLDDNSIEKSLNAPLKGLIDFENNPSLWMTQDFYRDYPLREFQRMQTWRVVDNGEGFDRFERFERVNYEDQFIEKNHLVRLVPEKRAANDWLCHDTRELRDLCEEWGIKVEEGMRFELNQYGNNADGKVIFDPSFGFVLQ